MKKPINRRSFVKLFTGGLLGAGLLPMVGNSDSSEFIHLRDLKRQEMLDSYNIPSLKPMVGSVAEVNGCTVVRIERDGELSYFVDADNYETKIDGYSQCGDAFTEWADGENLHWEKIELDPGFETKTGQDAFEDWGVCDPDIRYRNLAEMAKDLAAKEEKAILAT